MRWHVEVMSMDKTDAQSVVVEAESWQRALQAARTARGEKGPISGFSIELLDEGYRAVDPLARLRFDVKKAADDAPLTDLAAVARPAAPVALQVPPRPAPAETSVEPAGAAPQSAMAPKKKAPPPPPAAKPAAKKTTSSGKMRATAPLAPTPILAFAPTNGGSPDATIRTEALHFDAPLPPPPPSEPSLPVPATQIIFKREHDPTERLPLTYREYVFTVARGVDEAAGERLLRTQLGLVRSSIAGARGGKFVNLAVFDTVFQGRPPVPPLATLAWKDWRGEPQVVFPRRPQPAQPTPSSIRPPAPLAPASVAPVAHAPAPVHAHAPAPVHAHALPHAPVAAHAPAPFHPPAPASFPPPAAFPAPSAPPAAHAPPAPPVHPASVPAPPAVNNPFVSPFVPAPVDPFAPGVAPLPPGVPVPAFGAPAPPVAAASQPPPPQASAPPITPQAIVSVAPAQAVSGPPVEAPLSAAAGAFPLPFAIHQIEPTPPPPQVAPPPAPAPSAGVTGPHRRSADSSQRLNSRMTPTPSRPSLRPLAGGRRASGDELIANLFEAMHELNFARDVVEGGDYVLALALDMIPSRAGIVHLYDIDHREYVVACVAGIGVDPLLNRRHAENEPVLSAAMRKRRAMVMADATTDASILAADRFATLGGATSVIISPVMKGGRFLGVLELVNPLDGIPFTDEEGNAVDYLAEQFGEFVATIGMQLDPARITRSVPPPG
jgi:hypothetical protein